MVGTHNHTAIRYSLFKIEAINELDHNPTRLPQVAPKAYTTLSIVEPNATFLTLKDQIRLIIKAAIKTPKYISFAIK